jgi:Domain of unknown function (DUF4357)
LRLPPAFAVFSLPERACQLLKPRNDFSQDYSFSSPSTAAAVVLGRSANGRVEWKAADGRTLKEIQEAEAELMLLFL